MKPSNEQNQEEEEKSSEDPQSMQDVLWMRHALALAEEASLLGEVPVGAIVVYKNTIIGAAHNLRETLQDPTAHAETLALTQAAKHIGSWRLEDCTLYVTLEPCPMCSGALWLARIARCVYGCTDPRSGYLGSIHNLMDHTQLNHHYEITSGTLEKECSQILRTFFGRIRRKKSTKKSQTSG
jgi:tRNA(adenine34) deaminase